MTSVSAEHKRLRKIEAAARNFADDRSIEHFIELKAVLEGKAKA